MEIRDWLMFGNFLVAFCALAISFGAFWLARARDQREAEAKLPTCEIVFDKLTGQVATDAIFRVKNNGSTQLTLKEITLSRPKGKTKSVFPVEGQSFFIGVDLNRANMLWELDRERVLPGDVFEKKLTLRVEALEAAGISLPMAIFTVVIRMGGPDDQERRFTIRRTIKA